MNIREQIDELGFTIIDQGLAVDEVNAVLRGLQPLEPSLHSTGRGGVRDVLRTSAPARGLVTHPSVRRVVEAVLGPSAFAVRGVLFDKHAEANWKVPWHQDLTIAVRHAVSAAGYGPWSEKAGVPHVQPPQRVLEGMLTVRIHLDDCGSSNGPVRVIAGSHQSGRLSDAAIAAISRSGEAVTCACRRGGLLVMRPLLVHGSSSATAPSRRRVLHLDFASCSLAEGLEWSEQWRCAA
jgi:ectoine hydroxylase-related dioxygenase (phytanoyl-CoA dioxygenase family)